MKDKGKREKLHLAGPARIRARFDAAQTTKDNARHWSAADCLSADQEASPEVRRVLLNAARWAAAGSRRPAWPDWARNPEAVNRE